MKPTPRFPPRRLADSTDRTERPFSGPLNVPSRPRCLESVSKTKPNCSPWPPGGSIRPVLWTCQVRGHMCQTPPATCCGESGVCRWRLPQLCHSPGCSPGESMRPEHLRTWPARCACARTKFKKARWAFPRVHHFTLWRPPHLDLSPNTQLTEHSYHLPHPLKNDSTR